MSIIAKSHAKARLAKAVAEDIMKLSLNILIKGKRLYGFAGSFEEDRISEAGMVDNSPAGHKHSLCPRTSSLEVRC